MRVIKLQTVAVCPFKTASPVPIYVFLVLPADGLIDGLTRQETEIDGREVRRQYVTSARVASAMVGKARELLRVTRPDREIKAIIATAAPVQL